jgi:hypothetical protein
MRPLSDIQLQLIKEKFQYNEVTGILYRKFESLPPGKALKNSVGRLIKKKRVTILKEVGGARYNLSLNTSVTYDGVERTIMVHSVAWYLYYGKWPEGIIDHINGDNQDNRIVNLRIGTKGEIQRQPKKEGTISAYKGVSFHTANKNKPYYARIADKCIGNFDTEEEAARAYDEKAKEIYGDLCFLNFPAAKKITTNFF